MDYLAQSIEKAHLQAAEEDFNTCFGGSYPEFSAEDEATDEALIHPNQLETEQLNQNELLIF